MAIIKVENLTFSYPSNGENIFENVNLQIDSDWKLGFIGRNGRGKTTFLDLLQGKYEYRGKIISSVRFDYFPYAVKDKTERTEDVLRKACPTAEQWQFIRELSYLDMDCACLYRPFATLSNGEQTKALLAALFLNEGDFLLIDEPTDHLDLRARQLLSAYLRKKKSFIVVSHDRCFLDGCVDHILALNKTSIDVQSGNFSSYMTNFERRLTFEQTQNERLMADIDRLRESARRTTQWADIVEASKIGAGDKGYVGHKSAKMMKRAKTIEQRRDREIEQKSRLLNDVEHEIELKITPLRYHAERIASFTAVSPVYDGKQVCAPVTFEIKRGERVALRGKNGSGKSSLLKLLCDRRISHTGEVYKASDLIVSYVPQDCSDLCGTLSEFATAHGIDESLFRTILYKMGVNKNQFDKDIAQFSNGQKKKTLLAKSLCEKAHLYVWDEPLNYIDIFTRMQLETLLGEFFPTMIFVEHDKSFSDKISTKIIEL